MISFSHCEMCPRKCGADRTAGQFGFCHETAVPHLAWAGLHKGEEPPVSGERGSGMLFFRGCPLGCAFCQNHSISLPDERDSVFCPEVTEEDILAVIRDIAGMGAESISFVTAEHFAPLVASVSEKLKESGFRLPLVFNTSGWISVGAISDLLPYIDVWLWDTKTRDSSVAARFCGSDRYPDEERKSFSFLCDSIGATDLEGGRRSIIVRHLVIPGEAESSLDVIREFAPYRKKCMFSLMSQFVNPYTGVGMDDKEREDYRRIEKFAIDSGIEDGFLQEEGDESLWVPDFGRDNPFPSDYAVPSPAFLDLKRRSVSGRD